MLLFPVFPRSHKSFRQLLSSAAWIVLLSSSLRADEPMAESDKALRQFLTAHCQDCHGPKVQKAGLRLDTLPTNYALRQNADRWRDVLDRLNTGDMPPEPRPRPKAPELLAVTEQITANLKKAEAARLANGGAVVLRRLNRTQYENTIHDLFGIRIPVKAAFPEDPPQFGFDNIGSALNVSAPLLTRYVEISETVVDRVISTGGRPDLQKEHFDVGRLDFRVAEMAAAGKSTKSVRVPRGPAFRDHSPGSTGLEVRADGEYIVRLRLSGVRRPGDPPPRLLARLDETNDILFEQDVETPENEPTTLQTRLWLAKGDYHLVLRNMLVNPGIHDTFDWKDKRGNPRASVLLIDWFELEGPIVDGWPTKAHQQIFFRGPQATKDLNYASEILKRFLNRAYRRPATKGEVERMLRIVERELKREENFEEAIKLTLAAALCSPEFLFLVEPATDKVGRRPLNDWELASRLSYFLWSTMPDEELFELARAGRLHEKKVLDGQVQRMLEDPKSSALVDNFTFQWLQLGKIGQFRPDAELYPDYDRHLEQSMVREAKAFFTEVLRNDLSVWNFIDSDWAMLNERLARHYGVSGVTGDDFRKVKLAPDQHRGGLLTQAGILSLTSDGTRHRPVNRGVWVLETILANPPPPPPPNVGEIEPNIPNASKLTVRARLEKHRSIESCAACHRKIDPLGFAFEHYDAVGSWRDKETVKTGAGADPAVDARSSLPDGRTFDGVDGLKAILKKDENKFLHCLCEKMLTYALGRGLEFSDRATLDDLRNKMKNNGYTLRGLIRAVVATEAFQTK